MERIGKRIRQLRDHLGLTAAQFASKIDVQRGAVTNWELNDGIKQENIRRIVERFGVTYAWLAEGIGEMGNPSLDHRPARVPPPTGYVSEADALVGFETLAHLLGIAQTSAPRVAQLLLQAVLSQQEGVYPEDRAALIRRDIRDAIHKSLSE